MFNGGHVFFSRCESKEQLVSNSIFKRIETFQADLKKRRDTDVKKVNP